MSWTVRNEGTESTYYTRWYDRIVLSVDDRYGGADDVELAGVRYEGALEPGEQYTVHAEVQLPVGSEGVYHIFVATDADNRVYEYMFEDNNVRRADLPITVELTPYADLEVGEVSAPEETLGTDPVAITWVVTNRGEGTTGDGTPGGTVSEWVDRIVLSRNTTFGDADDRLVAEVPRSGELGHGHSYTGSWTGILPAGLSGEYYVFVETDAGGAVYEHDNTFSNVAQADDSTLVRQWTVEPGPLAEDTVWDGTVVVLGTVTVPAGITLTIEPGAFANFVAGGLDVYGKLKVLGTTELPVILTSAAETPTPGDWTGLIVRGTGHAELENFEIRYATTAIHANYQGAKVHLAGGVIRDSSQYGIYVYAPYVEVTAENVVIANSGSTGVFMRASSRGTFTNCTIVGNGFNASGFRRAGVHIGAATMVFDNSIVAFNANGFDHSSADPSETTVRQSLFYNPAGQNIIWTAGGPEPRLDRNGNIVADPLFVDRAAGNYELAAGSPAIDAGRAIGAPPTDILGRARFDDVGLENRGSGNPSYVDIGAYERQESSLPYADLALVSVSASPLDMGSGDTITVTWTVENTGQRALTDAWVDTVYLSSDPYLSTATDRLLTEIPRTEELAVGARYTQTWTGAIPADLAGPLYVIVRTNSGRAFRESTSLNNTRTFDQVVAVAIPTLTTDAPQTGHVGRGEWAYYRFDAEPGRSVLFELDSAVSSGAVHLYLRRGAVPTVSNYHVAATTFNRPDQQLRLLEPSAGVYYIGVYGQSLGAGGTGFTLTAELTELAIRQVTPGTVGNAGPVTVEIVGDNFTHGAHVTLVGPDGVTVIEGDPWFEDASTLYGTFDLAEAGAEPGVYDVVVTLPGLASVTKPGALTVQSGGAGVLATNLTVPGLTRPGRTVEVSVRYANTGTIDLPSPLMTLASIEGLAWRLPGPSSEDRWSESPTVRFLALSSDGPAATLRPGQSETIRVTARTPFAAGNLPFTLYSFGSPGDAGLTDPLDWGELGEELRPTDLPDDAWNPLLARLQAQIGSTWDDYLNALRDNADHLAEIGQRVYDHGDLFGFEFVQATSMGAPALMEAAQDAFAPASGLPLSFERYFLPEPVRRARLGPLGRGWMHSYQITLQERSDGSVAIHGPSTGFDRSFQPDGIGGYLAGRADNATLTALPDGEFLLTEPSGLKYLFRSDGRWAWIEESNGNRLTGSYDAQGRLVRVTHSNADRFLFEYDAAGRLVKLIDHADRATHYTYDESGEHLVAVTGPDGEPTTFTYLTGAGPLLDHHLTSITRPGGVHIEFHYDDLGRLAGESFADGREPMEYTYSTAGRTVMSDVFGNTTTAWLDGRGQTAMVEDPLGNRARFTYDAAGNLVTIVGPTALTEEFMHDAVGNVVAARDAMGRETTFAYGGPYDNLTLVRDARGNAHRYAYDAAGNLTRITYEDGTHEDFQYDDAGNLLAWTNRRGDTITYAYNARGQLVGKNDPDTPGVVDFLYTYDTAGNLTAATGPEGTTVFTYHPDTQRLVRIDYPAVGGRAIYLTFDYDAAGRRTRSVDQDGHVLNFAHDAAGRLDRMTDAADDLVVDYEYDAAGRLVRKTLGNGVYTTYAYDAASQLVSLVNHQPDGTVLSHFDYTYNALGRRVAMDTHYGQWTYGYDATGQLTRAVLVSTDPDIPDQDLTYVYDAVGNRIRTIMNGEVTEYTTTNMNQYVEVGDRTYVFDADGNLIQETGPDGTTAYTYNTENRVIAVSRGEDAWQYTYDALGNRVAVHENGDVTRYVIDPAGFGNVVGEYDAAGNRIARYNHGYGLVARTDASSGQLAWYTFDAIGSTSELTGSAGGASNSYVHDPFGVSLAKSEPISNPFEYVGEFGVMHDSNGLEFMRARFYDAELGRFGSTDPVRSLEATVNAFTYALNNPISLVDPTGLKGWSPPTMKELNPKGTRNAKFLDGLGNLLDEMNRQLGGKEYWDSQGNIRVAPPEPRITPPDIIVTWEEWEHGIITQPGTEVWVLPEGEETLRKMREWAKDHLPWLPPMDFDSTPLRGSHTPEDKFGPSGYDDPAVQPGDEDRFILPGQVMEYRIDFWNHEDAEVPTQDAVIFDWLDPDVFDVSTFEFTRIGFLDWDMPLPGGQAIDVRIDARPQMNIAVEVRGGWEMNVDRGDGQMVLDDPTGKLVWWFHTIDPETGDYPDDPMAGFLPPFNPQTEYELGWVEFRVKAWDDLHTGTRIENQAFVQFDFMPNPKTGVEWGPAPPDGPWVNTIDAGPPESWVEPLPEVVNTAEFLVTWDGQDDEGGSGIARYDVYISTDGGPFTRWLAGTTDTSATFSGEHGRSYAFYAVATDNVGHREAEPTAADATTYVNIAPSIDTLTADPDPVTRPGRLTLTAAGATDLDGYVTLVEFWRGEVDGEGRWLGLGVEDNGDWILRVSTAGWTAGEHTLLARAQDNEGAWSEAVGTTVHVVLPIHDLAAFVPTNGAWRVSVSDTTRFHASRWGSWDPAVNWVDVLVADFTGNGLDDIAARNVDTGEWYVAMNQEDGSFTTKRWETWNPNVTWEDVLVGDFNNDGKADIVARVGGEGGNGSVRVSLSNGSRFHSARWEVWNPAVDWAHVMVGNFAPATPAMPASSAPFPNSQSDFQADGRLGRLEACPGTDAAQRIDLLTAVMHEFGYLLGRHPKEDGLMQPALVPGVRWLPESEADLEPAGVEALFDDKALEPARLDAYFAALEAGVE